MISLAPVLWALKSHAPSTGKRRWKSISHIYKTFVCGTKPVFNSGHRATPWIFWLQSWKVQGSRYSFRSFQFQSPNSTGYSPAALPALRTSASWMCGSRSGPARSQSWRAGVSWMLKSSRIRSRSMLRGSRGSSPAHVPGTGSVTCGSTWRVGFSIRRPQRTESA